MRSSAYLNASIAAAVAGLELNEHKSSSKDMTGSASTDVGGAGPPPPSQSGNQHLQVPQSPTRRRSSRKGGIALRCEKLCVNRGEKRILHEVSVCFAESEFVAIMGASGAGKTTFLNSLMGRPGVGASWNGSLVFDSVNMTACSQLERDELRARMGYVTQDDIMLRVLTPREALRYRLLSVGADYENVDEEVASMLRRMGLEKCADTKVGDEASSIGGAGGLSGGELSNAKMSGSGRLRDLSCIFRITQMASDAGTSITGFEHAS